MQKLCNSVIRQKRDSAGWDVQITTGYFNFCAFLLHYCWDFAKITNAWINARVDFNTSAQRQQLFDGRFGDRANNLIIQSTVANADLYAQRRV